MTIKSCSAASSSSSILAQERVELHLVGAAPARVRAPARSMPGGEVRDAEVRDLAVVAQHDRARRASPPAGRRRSASAAAAGRRSRSRAAPASPRRRRTASGVALVARDLRRQQDLLARHAGVGDPAPDLALVAVGARGVDVPVADLQRVARPPRGASAPSICQVPKPSCGTVVPWISSDRSNRAIRSPTHPAASHAPVGAATLARLPGRLAQLGERRLDKAEVTGSSPVSPTPKGPPMRGFCRFQTLSADRGGEFRLLAA